MIVGWFSPERGAEQPQCVSRSNRNFRRRNRPHSNAPAAIATMANEIVCCQSTEGTYAQRAVVQRRIFWRKDGNGCEAQFQVTNRRRLGFVGRWRRFPMCRIAELNFGRLEPA
jgi:hypothetical protein